MLLLTYGDMQQALAVYQRAIDLYTEDAAVYRGKGDALCALRRYDDAFTAYEQAHRLDYHSRGVVYNLTHKKETVAAYWREIRRDLNDTYAHQDNNHMLYKFKSFAKALIILWRVIRLASDDAYAYKIRSLALPHLGRYNEAAAAYEQSIQLSSKDLYDSYH